MKHLGHQNRKKDVYDGDMVVYRGIMGDFWGVMGAKREAKGGQTTNLHLPESARRVRGGRKEGARRVQGGCKEGASMGRKEICNRQGSLGSSFLSKRKET